MGKLKHYRSVLDIRRGEDPVMDALLLHFMTENGLEYTIDPLKNASPEQIRFMMACKDETFYAPCSDWMLLQLLQSRMSPELQEMYLQQWRSFVRLVRMSCHDPYQRRKIMNLARHKFQMVMDSCITIPSRVMKRLITIFMSQSGIDDPHRQRKQNANAAAQKIVESTEWERFVNQCPETFHTCRRMDDLRFEMDFLEMQRLICASTLQSFDHWSEFFQDCGKVEEEIRDGHQTFHELHRLFSPQSGGPLRVLFLPYNSGGLLFDLQLIRAMLRRGHRVVLALKEGFYFDAPAFWDMEHDSVLAECFKEARVLTNVRISKNELLRETREHPFVIISDGTRERLNPYRMSVTLARVWKESDLIMVKGQENYRRTIMTSHSFTRDIFSYFRDDSGKLVLNFKPKASWARKFREVDILAKAEAIIADMRRASAAGNTVMFYSGIVGSIPGQTSMAIEVMNTFIRYLRSRLDGVYIINPAEHFEEGMDADDLMYMWEKVQRSGFIDVWRFQSVQDIERSFELMNRKVPPVWAGKDATYSTGCTKEMNIALDVQKKHRELQIIGPSPEKFFRRREYGVGKFCDVAIEDCNETHPL
jgi:uncharacterized protein with ATP-grasp and redox domains